MLYYLAAIAKLGTILRGFHETAALHFPQSFSLRSYVTVCVVRLQWRIWLNLMLLQILPFLFLPAVSERKTAISTLQTNSYVTHGHLIPFARLGRIEHRADLIPAEPILIERLVDILVTRWGNARRRCCPLCCLDAPRRLGVLSLAHKWVRRMLMFDGCRRDPGCQTAGVCFR